MDNRSILLTRVGVVAIVVFALLGAACSRSKNKMVSSFDDMSAVPTLRTLDVETLISDSGVIRYRIKSPEWLIYENAPEPYWLFPRKLYVEKFDSILGTEALFNAIRRPTFRVKSCGDWIRMYVLRIKREMSF